jgi:methylamine dehydrogenase accessory protein MauD
METPVLLLFLTTRCAVCASILPSVKQLVRESKGNLRWALIARGGREECARFRREYGLNDVLFAYVPSLHKLYKVSLAPYAIVIGKDGRVVAKGLVNQIENLESLLEVPHQADDSEGKGSRPFVGAHAEPHDSVATLLEPKKDTDL